MYLISMEILNSGVNVRKARFFAQLIIKDIYLMLAELECHLLSHLHSCK